MSASRYSKLQFTFVCGCLIYLLSACSLNPFTTTQTATPQAAATSPTATPASTPSPPTTVPMPPTQTDCPAAGTARAMVTAPLVLGSHPAIVYTVNQTDPRNNNNPLIGTLKRYDVITGNKTVIANIPDMSIYNAQVSTDGQWVLFTSLLKQLNMTNRDRCTMPDCRLYAWMGKGCKRCTVLEIL